MGYVAPEAEQMIMQCSASSVDRSFLFPWYTESVKVLYHLLCDDLRQQVVKNLKNELYTSNYNIELYSEEYNVWTEIK